MAGSSIINASGHIQGMHKFCTHIFDKLGNQFICEELLRDDRSYLNVVGYFLNLL